MWFWKVSSLCSLVTFLFFFFKQKTAYEMRISDWSSDVCSSDLLTSSAAPSIASVYAAAPDMTDTVMLAISQSGKSPDLVTALAAARARGAYGIALVNADASPLAAGADLALQTGRAHV